MTDNIVESIKIKTYFSLKFINDFNNFIKDLLNLIDIDKKANESINLLINIVKQGSIGSQEKKIINDAIYVLGDIFELYDEIKNNPEITNNIIQDIDELEKQIDSNIDEYQFTKSNPMKGISWNKSKQKYLVRYKVENKSINTVVKTLSLGAKKIINLNKCSSNGIFEVNEENIQKFSFNYNENQFITYYYENQFYFDINHLINVFKVKNKQRDYILSNNKNLITHYLWHKNKYGGYFMRKLISEESMYLITLNSRSKFAKEFKKDVAKILVELRKNNNLEISENRLVLRTDDSYNLISDSITNIRHYSYDNIVDTEYVYTIIRKIIYSNLAVYLYENVLYAFIILHPNCERKIILKFGFSCEFVERYLSLKKEYKCNVFLIKLKLIKNQKVEKKFHNALQKLYPSMIYKTVIDNHEKTELYYFNPILMNFYDNYDGEIVNTSILETCNDNKYNSVLSEINISDQIFLDVLRDMNIENNNKLIEYIMNRNNNELEIERIKSSENDKQRKHEIECLKLQSLENDKKREHEYRMAKLNKLSKEQ